MPDAERTPGPDGPAGEPVDRQDTPEGEVAPDQGQAAAPRAWKPAPRAGPRPARGDGKAVYRLTRRDTRRTEALRETLAGKEAEALALREQLADLRRSLAAETTGVSASADAPPDRSPARQPIGGVPPGAPPDTPPDTPRGAPPGPPTPGYVPAGQPRGDASGRTKGDTPALEQRPRREGSRRLALLLLLLLIGVPVLGVLAVPPLVRAMTGSGSPVSSATPSPPSGSPSGSPSGAPSASASGTGDGRSPTSTGSGTPAPSPTVALTPLPWPGGAVLVPPGLSSSGPGVDAPGSDVAVAIDPDQRHLDVFERVAFPAPGVGRLELDVPDVAELTRTLGRRSVPAVEDLQVQLGDRVVPVTDAGDGRLTAQVADGRPVRTAVLRYRLDGALFQAPNSPARRYYGVVTPLAAGTSLGAGRPVQVRVVGDDIRNVTCPLAAAPLCGQPQGSGWTARLPSGGGPVVLLQLTLPER